ncbi:hypothetical protein BRCON_2546 [Candidatus Sumerlaea chitinivorans]|uniref:Uncharacterized protein n=1 Tax=Sumerlaea chitinivorans TaxID=2250252 RepID=A0A2Z4Y8Y6_SUMC1|nr:hypothetical protein BRCON_2546 [Candidatus Sumerlaea chitinivorans]
MISSAMVVEALRAVELATVVRDSRVPPRTATGVVVFGSREVVAFFPLRGGAAIAGQGMKDKNT